MKINFKQLIIALTGIIMVSVTTSCFKGSCTDTISYIIADPVLFDESDYRKDVAFLPAQEMSEPGKIYYYNNFLLVNERYKGVHVIDNSDPRNPIKMGFIEITGNVDMAIQNNVLYADAFTDLLAIDLSNLQAPRIIKRDLNIFEKHYHYQDGMLIGYYIPTNETVKVPCDQSPFIGRPGSFFVSFDAQSMSMGPGGNRSFASNSADASGNIGVGGSMARFTVTKGHLYAIDESMLYSFRINTDGSMDKSHELNVGWGIETIYPFKEHLFIGANNGMHIIDINNPGQPQYRSAFVHALACDPVIVDDNIAYVTLRTGNACFGSINQLDVVDVSDVYNPKLMHSHSMQNPHGLSKYSDNLFICEGKYGLKSFDAKDPSKISSKLQAQIKNIHAYDAIALSGDLLLVIGEGGFFQYDISDRKSLKLLSQIKTKA
jgi:hypothetical protein